MSVEAEATKWTEMLVNDKRWSDLMMGVRWLVQLVKDRKFLQGKNKKTLSKLKVKLKEKSNFLSIF